MVSRSVLLLVVAMVVVAGVALRTRANHASADTPTATPTPLDTPTPVPSVSFTPTNTRTPTDTATPTPIAHATFSVADGGTHAINEVFAVDVGLSDVGFDAGHSTWSGYDIELEYDDHVIHIDRVDAGICSPLSDWFVGALAPAVVTACAFQSSTVTAGTLETITFTCATAGTSDLHIVAEPDANGYGSDLYDELGNNVSLTLVDASVSCDGALPTATATPGSITPTPTDTPIPTSTPVPAHATFLTSNGGTHAISESFTVNVMLGDVTFDALYARWAGYDVEVHYDPAVLVATADTIAGANPCGQFWANVALQPDVVSGCTFQSSNASNLMLETITFRCIGGGTSPIHFVPRAFTPEGTGTALFEDRGANDFPMTLVDTNVNCDAGLSTATRPPTNTADLNADACPDQHQHTDRYANGYADRSRPRQQASLLPRATFSVAPGGAHAIGNTFTVDVLLSDVGFGSWSSMGWL